MLIKFKNDIKHRDTANLFSNKTRIQKYQQAGLGTDTEQRQRQNTPLYPWYTAQCLAQRTVLKKISGQKTIECKFKNSQQV